MPALLADLHTAPPHAASGEPALYTPGDFARFCADYPDLRAELTPAGKIVIMPPAGDETSSRNADLTADLVVWNRTAKLGKVFDSSAGFTFPDGAVRSPDTAWVELSRWNALPPEQQGRFASLCPDFAAELLSPTDRLSTLQAKMRVYAQNGVRLGWLLNPRDKSVEVYRLDGSVEVLSSPVSLSGEDVLPGFTLDLAPLWA